MFGGQTTSDGQVENNRFTSDSGEDSMSILRIICFIAVVFIAFCMARRFVWICYFALNSRNLIDITTSGRVYGQTTQNRGKNNPTYETICSDLSIPLYKFEEITLFNEIGKGFFGRVFKGELNGRVLAVKEFLNGHYTEAFREIKTMAYFAHPNILSLFGYVIRPDSDCPWVLLEFMEHGDLRTLLRNSPFRPSGLRGYSTTSSSIPHLHLTQSVLTNMALQIADGMKYLSLQHFVHRDLAARNCLVSSTGIVKIADFGLARDIYTCNYFKTQGSEPLPVRWMAPESFVYGIFTLQSDVWAYGVVLWEIFSWGKQPYYWCRESEVVELILKGGAHFPPSDCSHIVKEIMASCFKTDARDRPTFKQICEKFHESGYRQGQNEDNHTMVDISQLDARRKSEHLIPSCDFSTARTCAASIHLEESDCQRSSMSDSVEYFKVI